ncbi:MAG: FKBP-type peptidyl-prolyl cis-trans isomerase [Candidatus Nomurabacteria bacterium]|nr:FKBP-type peptidyl-prolyl cis-trans isomerase [Candidatus Saccharibacteria bacterium]USN95386.1 MAG: FKBP-type peptidyl-prolyl cis-trans isomerase [Candidatus Nomurabacteria bacterium]
MGQTTQRAFALSLAILFLITTIGFSAYVMWEMFNQKDTTNTANQQQQQQSTNTSQEPKDYMQGFEPMGDTRVTELKTTDIKVGTGTEAVETSTVKVEYTGALTKDGSIFDSTDKRGGEPAEFALSGVVPGFRQGIVGMKVGGERQILIPASLGYGAEGNPPAIPADSDLVFNVKLVEVK